MTTWLVLSDSHSNVAFIQQALDRHLTDVNGVIHLGDDFQDMAQFLPLDVPCIQVPGTWTSEYQSASIDNRRFETIAHWNCFLTHTPTSDSRDRMDDIVPEHVIHQSQCDVFFHGHTHCPETHVLNGVCIHNPGHIKSTKDRGFPATYSLVTFSDEHVTFTSVDYRSGSSQSVTRFYRETRNLEKLS